MIMATEQDNERRFDGGAWAIFIIALGYLIVCAVAVLLGFAQPGDGWLYSGGLGANNILVANQTGEPSGLQPGDEVIAIAGALTPTSGFRPLTPPPAWEVDNTVIYQVRRDGVTLDVAVTLAQRPPSTLWNYLLRGTGIGWPPLLTGGLWLLIALIIFLLRPGSTAARLLMLIVAYWSGYDALLSADSGPTQSFYPPLIFWLHSFPDLLWPLIFAMVTHLLLAFPVRKWPLTRAPRLSLALLYGLPTAGVTLVVVLNNIDLAIPVLFQGMLILVISLIAATAHNLITVRDPIARAQIGWMAIGLGAPLLTAIIIQLALFAGLITSESPVGWIWPVATLLMPLCLGIAITRYRLFDIDVIIRRTLTYTLLTLSLGAVYFLGVVALQELFVRLTGAESTLAVVASTLAIAALFQPLRSWVQTIIDRRFFRKKYDAQQVLEQFARRAQQESDLDSISADIVQTVRETLEPEDVRLWLVRRRP